MFSVKTACLVITPDFILTGNSLRQSSWGWVLEHNMWVRHFLGNGMPANHSPSSKVLRTPRSTTNQVVPCAFTRHIQCAPPPSMTAHSGRRVTVQASWMSINNLLPLRRPRGSHWHILLGPYRFLKVFLVLSLITMDHCSLTCTASIPTWCHIS